MTTMSKLNRSLQVAAIAAIVTGTATVSALDWPTKPLSATVSAKPLTMLIAGRDHKFFYEAYNDASDIDGDGILDTRFKPGITYYGLYDSTLCYGYSGTGNTGLFQPQKAAGALGICDAAVAPSTARWSGNWLNYVTTSRIDALRKVLYGGSREVDSSTQTVLRRSYIPQDAHSWGKEYHRSHGYKISDYTDLADLTVDNVRHFFGNLTANRNTDCSTLDTCSNLPPLLRIRANVGNNARIWEWASKERPVLHDNLSTGGFPSGTAAERNLTVRVEVCTSAFNSGCKRYPNGQYKPIGLLHDYGETDAMLFGLITGSYDQHMSGGRLRKVVSSFSDEVTANTGQFVSGARIVTTFDKLRIRGFNQSSTSSEYWKSNPYEDSAKSPTEGQLIDWGNPIGEMMYEGIRYFSGKKSATSAYNTSTTFDTAVGLSSVTWDDPYDKTASAAKASFCARANFLTISDINPSFDGDQVPGSYWNVRGTTSKFTGDIGTINSELLAKTIGDVEALTNELFFIGEVGAANDTAPTPKTLTSLGRARGLSPEEPTKQGSFSAAAMAYYAKTTDLRTEAGLSGNQTVDTYAVALSSPLPRIEARMNTGRIISLVPFAKSIGGSGINRAKGNYQPTNQIVDFYVEQIANSSGPTGPDYDATVNGGRYYARFQINYEDVEQGGDHDMDAIAEYTVQVTAANTLQVIVRPTYQAGGMQQNMGYVISGTTKDGVYLVAQDEAGNPAYYLNVPTAASSPNGCDLTTVPANCAPLPTIGQTPLTFEFTPSASGGARLLRDPLWYAAKWGGFTDRNSSKTPDLPLEWDADGDGVPDTYFLVQNPLKLRDSLKKAFDNIVQRSGSGGNVIANSTSLSTNSLVYQGSFNATNWSGDLAAYAVTASGVSPNPQWRAADSIPGHASRRIVYRSRFDNQSRYFTETGIAANTTDRDTFGNNNTERNAMVRYLRGERTLEIQNGGTLRNRAPGTVLGDISHSSPAYVSDNGTVFIGANDGMLHAFNASTGVERFAYIPSSAMPAANTASSGIRALSQVIYNDQHQYFVDGDITVSNRNQLNNKNYLVGTLGRGGKGLFTLDVTNPDSFSPAEALWESAGADPDMGHVLGRPVIARMENGAWAVIVGNGYNSRATASNSRAVLFIYELATGNLIRKIDTGVAGDNGLATPGVYDSDNNGRIDTIYSGDLQGNVWKFDLSSVTPASWNVALGGQPMFKAVDAGNKAQPITGPISVSRNSVPTDPNAGRTFIHFGTGSYFRTTDPNDDSPQTLYGLIDRGTVIENQTSPTNKLVQREVEFTGVFGGANVRVFTKAAANDMAGKDGFYMNLPGKGERVVTAAAVYNLNGPVLLFSSIVPVFDECSPGGSGFLNAIDPFTGGRITRPFFDINRNGDYLDDVLGGVADRFIGSIDLGLGNPGQATVIDNQVVVGGSDDKRASLSTDPGSVTARGRLSWREIVRD
ncbi:pilus assembly protein [Hydrogenophaga sp.]|uniref:pilus assembly protein n=1 Tax=Hydrogenophaga sp. TaxID=1904254 RepID=UPI002ABB6C25|nr:PilC/PilY family type IV pilus protein [Hydrogenophaga sp.]MDZ4398520.1 PilC/PilY family type IV pilus protein [Hydrogenophaga sp.]